MTITANFGELGISPVLINKLANMNITEPTPVQWEAIPLIMGGKDVIAQAPTGTGKTMAYVLPLLAAMPEGGKSLQALVLAPTRELAMQIVRVFRELGDEQLSVVALLGGGNLSRQLDGLKKKPQVVVGTPGRVLEVIQKRKLHTQDLKTLVVDEGDKLFASDFAQDVTAILRTIGTGRQVLFFSATLPQGVADKAAAAMREPQFVRLVEKTRTATTLEHVFFMAEEKLKTEVLKKLTTIYKPQKALIFINHNEGVGPLAKRLQQLGLSVVGLHSELADVERKRLLELFRKGGADYLVTTDLLARGLDVPGIDYVFNFDVPFDAEHYIHRVGRTGRAGQKGIAVTLVTAGQNFLMEKYARSLKIKLQLFGIGEDKVFPVVLPTKARRVGSRQTQAPKQQGNQEKQTQEKQTQKNQEK